MSGHRSWSKVKRFKGAIDAKRGKIFSKLSKEITIAAKSCGGDPMPTPVSQCDPGGARPEHAE